MDVGALKLQGHHLGACQNAGAQVLPSWSPVQWGESGPGFGDCHAGGCRAARRGTSGLCALRGEQWLWALMASLGSSPVPGGPASPQVHRLLELSIQGDLPTHASLPAVALTL